MGLSAGLLNPKTALNRLRESFQEPDNAELLNALPVPVIALNGEDMISYINGAAENLLKTSQTMLIGHPLTDILPEDTPVMSLVAAARSTRAVVSEHELPLEGPKFARLLVSIRVGVVSHDSGDVIMILEDKGIADMIDRQRTHRGAARSVSSMAAMLAHEIRNPLSGIRGAAQLLESNADEQDRPLAELIRQETDRISSLIDRMDAFSSPAQALRKPVNIHQVLDRVQRLGQSGFAQHARFSVRYDPSLPPVPGDRDQLIQVFLNLVKNAAEACPDVGGEIQLQTSYQQGVRFSTAAGGAKVELPLLVTVTDNGPGVPDEMLPLLFDPFVSSKRQGRGLGLAFVAKAVDDHGGIVECETRPGRTTFKVMLPVLKGVAPMDGLEDARDEASSDVTENKK